ncbi:hypothetical protein A8B84_21150 [Marinobacter sp. EhC06]|jgi:hypothetical protein|uniref:hypothetical protein n=1 Tax=Marinobacter TaxID=2742 RepID=UPI0007D8ED01|nr:MULTISPECIES: hypothetical protein [unclassified Marinobacter]OAN89380.1 hypothetical protein A8B80_21115 [Marinobacter sp. EhN04]OAN89926.1 hypothetical protein A8B84_21150 [Marinobacter sp. EhC06]
MFFRKQREKDVCHFRKFVKVKESWDTVRDHLAFRPKSDSESLLRMVFEDQTEAAFNTAARLLACYVYEKFENEFLATRELTEEKVLFECYLFSTSVMCNIVNPDCEQFEILQKVRAKGVEQFYLMSLLDESYIDRVAEDRCESYDRASESKNPKSFSVDIFCRVMQLLKNGAYPLDLKLRYEDPVNSKFYIFSEECGEEISNKMEVIISNVVKREMEYEC